ncbi:adenosine deaminase [Actinoplanes sp. ATCC 53533]|uniref:adenosine deaminase n=1 Tax=Actinoplanes sp. ATCC 53533 TaxID=1288362 RepID=UPI000F772470|nr:adenosine deaminase [Actinoplanes sp. ATCC 53533]RSM70075.1 adenosine deaminase [Actinoplanes sp. ATCC 53533]
MHDNVGPPTPKIELHVHLEGTVRPPTLFAIAHRNRQPLPVESPRELAELFRFRDLSHFIDVWNLTTACLRTADDFRRIVVDYAGEAKRHGAAYLEGIFTPEPAVATAIGLTRIFEGFCDGAAEAEQTHGVIVRLTPEQCRGCDPDFGAAVARAAVRYRGRGVVGFGLAGREGRYPDAPHVAAMRLAADGGLGLVPHAGEAAGPGSVRSALSMGVARIRHGVRAVEDPDLVAELAERRVVLDVCPTSNLRLRVATAVDHPLRRLAAAGVACSISTDDPAMFDTDLSTEYALAATLGVGPPAAYRAGLAGALCDEATRARLAALAPLDRGAQDPYRTAGAPFQGASTSSSDR